MTEHPLLQRYIRFRWYTFAGQLTLLALAICSRTDAQGRWGLIAPHSFDGREVLFSLKGHGIEAEVVVEIPHGAEVTSIHFQHQEGAVEVHHQSVDGVELQAEEAHGH